MLWLNNELNLSYFLRPHPNMHVGIREVHFRHKNRPWVQVGVKDVPDQPGQMLA